ncbi:uncharacterized protein [Hetaerina americana]|uniref:uncharacterized protein isoform X5 n=1 Tax=Hetaerina americana TaxID=62018 RepID=UPI003A7F4E61
MIYPFKRFIYSVLTYMECILASRIMTMKVTILNKHVLIFVNKRPCFKNVHARKRCLKIGVTFVLIWSAISLVVEVICLTINVTEMIYKKPMGAKPSLLIAVFFSGAWVFFYLYLYPLFVLLPVSALNSKNSSVSFVSLLLLTLWGKYLLDWYSSPFLKFLWMSTIKSFPENWLRSLLFIQKNDVTEKLMLIRKGEREKEKNMVKQRAQVEDVKTRQNSQTVMQTIRCVILLKKKLRRMRERKNIELPVDSHSN